MVSLHIIKLENMHTLRALLLPVFLLVSLVIFWELFIIAHREFQFILPAPSHIFFTFLSFKERLWLHTFATLKEMLGGFFLALAASFPLAFLMHSHLTTRLILQPLFLIIQCLPMFTLAPLMVLWFGWGYLAIVVPTALMIFFPLTLNIYQGLRATPQSHLDYFQLHRATYFQTLFKLRIPFALPHIFAGFRISAAIAGVGAIAGEWAGAQSGLGILMLESRRNTDLEITFCALIALTLLSSSLYLVILLLEKRIFRRYLFPSLKSATLTIALICLLPTLSGCQKQEKKLRLLLDWIPNVNHVPLYVAVEKGYFSEEGIHVKINKMFDSGGNLSYLTTNQADVIVSHLPAILKAASKGAEVKLIAPLIDCPLRAFIYRDSLQIQSPKDLNGNTLGYCLGGPETAFLDFLLSTSEITPGVRRNVSVDLISPMCTRQVDFIYGGYWNIETFQLRQLGIKVDYFPLDTLGFPSYDELVLALHKGSEYDNPKFHACFKNALKKSLDYCRAQPDQALKIYFEANPDKSEQTKTWEKEAWRATLPLYSKSLTFDQERIQKFYQWQIEHNIVTPSVNIEELL